MEEHVFKLANYKTKLLILIVAIILLGIWLATNIYSSLFVLGSCIILILSQINGLTRHCATSCTR